MDRPGPVVLGELLLQFQATKQKLTIFRALWIFPKRVRFGVFWFIFNLC